jgi:Fur family transcriptional regulator, ferric uptake regulator
MRVFHRSGGDRTTAEGRNEESVTATSIVGADEVLELLRRRGHRMTAQRRAIVIEIMASRGHIAPTDLVERVQGQAPGVNASTIYRTLELLEEVGILTHAHGERGPEYHHAYAHDHVHLICSNCGARLSVAAEDLGPAAREFASATGFQPDFTHFAVFGICENCS